MRQPRRHPTSIIVVSDPWIGWSASASAANGRGTLLTYICCSSSIVSDRCLPGIVGDCHPSGRLSETLRGFTRTICPFHVRFAACSSAQSRVSFSSSRARAFAPARHLLSGISISYEPNGVRCAAILFFEA